MLDQLFFKISGRHARSLAGSIFARCGGRPYHQQQRRQGCLRLLSRFNVLDFRLTVLWSRGRFERLRARIPNQLTAQRQQAIGGIQRANSLTQQRHWHLSGDGLVPRSVGEFTHQDGHDSPEKRVCDTSPMNPPASKHLSVNSATCGLMRITLDARVP